MANLDESKDSIDSTNPANLPPTGYRSDSPQAKEAIANLENIRKISTSGLGFTAKSAVLGGAAGGKAAEGALNPVTAFMQGAAAGLQIPSMLAAQKKDQLISAMDAAPLNISFPEIAEKYPYLAGFPTKLAIQTIQSIAIDTQKLAMTSQLRQKENVQEADLTMIRSVEDALPYAKMANQAYGLTGAQAIKPEELMNMRREDVDNFIKLKSGSGTVGEYDVTSQLMEKAPGNLAVEYGLPSERVNPYYKMPPKVFDKVKSANSVKANTVIGEAQEKASAMDVVINSLKKATAILDAGLQTGPITGRIPGRRLGAEAQEFDQIAKTILPSMRQGMPGAVSDRDMAIFKEANFGLEKDEAINSRIVKQQKAIAERIKAKADFLSNWATVYGDMGGAEAKWGEYATRNPLFETNGTPRAKVLTPTEYFQPGAKKTVDEPTAIPEGTLGTWNGKPVIRKNGKWELR